MCIYVPVSVRSMGCVCGCLLVAGNASSNPAGSLSVLIVVCCPVEVCATGQTLGQKIPTDCNASLYVI